MTAPIESPTREEFEWTLNGFASDCFTSSVRRKEEARATLMAAYDSLVAERDAARAKLAEINRIALEVMGKIQATAEKA